MLTLVFTDVEGSTRLLRTLGPRFAPLLEVHNDFVRGEVAACGGVVVRAEGDSFFCAFEDPAEALTACLNVQLRLSGHEWPGGADFKVRIGLHTGAVEPGGEDYIGLAVHQAARVADAAHGGQTVLSESTRQLLGEDLPADVSFLRLGSFRLKDFSEPTVLYQVSHSELPREFPALRALPAAAHNVPDQATLFVGRRTALHELAELVAGARLVTVVGAGGVGKTRLATEVVPLAVSSFPDGVWMIELAKLRGGKAVAAEIAATLGVRPEGERELEATLVDALRSRRLLLLLDNCEHVLEQLAPLVESLISGCPEVHVLATSREPLALPVERRYPLAPLSLPDAAGSDDPASSEAVALFVDRARIVAPGFDLAREQAAVIEICRRLDGLPLAIELAAARSAAIPPGRMAERLDQRFSMLRHGYRGRLSHHETLRASIAWSFELLEPSERILFARLSVFTGEFELEAAETVCGLDPLIPEDVLELIARLIEKSLVQPAGARYLMLESIREFAREKLVDRDEADDLVDSHIDYYTDFVDRTAEHADGPRWREAYDRLDAELPNIRLAVVHALNRSDPSALLLSASLVQYGWVRNRLSEVAHWCIDAAAIPHAPSSLRARALLQAGFGLVTMGSPDGGHALIDDALELARAAGDRRAVAEALLMAADMRLETGRAAQARPFAEEALALVRALGDDRLLGQALVIAARADHSSAGYEQTAARLTEALQVARRVGDRRQEGRARITLAFLSLECGELELAEESASVCLEISEAIEYPIGQAVTRVVSFWVALDRGQNEQAREQLEKALPIAREAGYQALLAYCLACEAALAARLGDDRRAAHLLGALDGASGALGGEGAGATRLRLEALRGELGARLGTELTRLLAEGERIKLDELA